MEDPLEAENLKENAKYTKLTENLNKQAFNLLYEYCFDKISLKEKNKLF